MSDEVTNEQTAQTADSVELTDSAVATMPSEAPEAPRDAVIAPPVKDDNSMPDTPESQPIETPKTAQTGEISHATPHETGTAQTPPSEPLGEPFEPIFSEPAPTPAEPVSPKPNLSRQLIAKAREAIQNRKRKKKGRAGRKKKIIKK